MSYEITINIVPDGDIERFEQICYTLPDSIPKANAIRLAREHAQGVNDSETPWMAIGVHVNQNGEPIFEREL